MTDSTNLSFGITLPFKTRCNLPDCQVATNRVYRVNIDGYVINFHSNDHARLGIERWQEKKKMGLKPGQPIRKEDPANEMVGDNMQDLEDGDE